LHGRPPGPGRQHRLLHEQERIAQLHARGRHGPRAARHPRQQPHANGDRCRGRPRARGRLGPGPAGAARADARLPEDAADGSPAQPPALRESRGVPRLRRRRDDHRAGPSRRRGGAGEVLAVDPARVSGRTLPAMSIQTTAATTARTEFVSTLSAAGLDAPWLQPGPLIRPKASAMQARVWRWRQIEPLVRRTPEFMAPGRGAERRILRLDNPGVPERTSGHTISVAVQYLLPGEVAPAHRHTPSPIRFMLHGEGAYTTIEGDKFVMRRGDLVVTPSMTWHDHGNEGREPVIWTDGLDSPVVRYLENLAMDPYEGEIQPVRTGPPARHLHYRWETAYAELMRRSAGEPDPFDDVVVEYLDPATGRSVVHALGCYLQM